VGSPAAEQRGRRVAFHTFGCKLNQFETEAIASSFRQRGFAVVAVDAEADVYVINTCTVTARADHKARSLIRGLSRGHPESLLVVTGCSAELEADVLEALAPNVVVIPQTRKAELLDLPVTLSLDGPRPDARALRDASRAERRDPFSLTVAEHAFHSRAYLKVQDGCDCRCAYCRVPLARGGSVSISRQRAVARVGELEALGYREIVITGVNISAYRSPDGTALAGLLESLIQGTRDARLRLSSLEPDAVTEELCSVLRHPRICPHFHLPVQSGSDEVLSRMGRRYSARRVGQAAELLRSAKDDPFLAADIIVGFPGETESDFLSTQRLVRDLGLAALHVFPFSSRPGTVAATFRPVVPERIRTQRARELAAISRTLAAGYASRWIGREVEVLLEKKGSPRARGVSQNYLKVDLAGVPEHSHAGGAMARAMITSAGPACKGAFLSFNQ
jgi:threonylcarbamoyladenosine tRNA methylthiotransferase MtaB